jgi:hypothetical protein
VHKILVRRGQQSTRTGADSTSSSMGCLVRGSASWRRFGVASTRLPLLVEADAERLEVTVAKCRDDKAPTKKKPCYEGFFIGAPRFELGTSSPPD